MIDAEKHIDTSLGFAIRDSQYNEANPNQPEQVASLFGWGGKLRPDIKTEDVIDSFNKNKGKAKGPTREQILEILAEPGADADIQASPPMAPDAPEDPLAVESPLEGGGDTSELLEEFQQTPSPTEKRTDERNINIERHHEGAMQGSPDVLLEQMESADDVARLLEASAKVQGLAEGPRTHEELAAATETPEQVRGILKDVFDADPKTIGALTDVQLLAGRRMMGTLGQEVAELANMISNGKHDPETLLLYQKKGEAFMALQAFMQGKVKEAARALSQQRMIAETLESSQIGNIADFMQMGSGLRTPEDVVRHAELTKKHVDKHGSEEGMVKGFQPQFRDYFKLGVEYWQNNILSGVETHAVNFIGSPTVALYEGLLVRPTAHAIGMTRQAFNLFEPKLPQNATIEQMELYNKRKAAYDERITMQEHSARLAGATIGLRDGMTSFVKAITTGQSQFGPEKGEEIRGAMHKVFGYHFGPAGETAAAAMTGSFRMLTAEDGFWKTNVFRTEFTALAARDAYAKGLDVNEHINDVLTNPQDHPELYEQAMHYSRKYTFTETDRPGLLGDLARTTKKFLTNHPYMKFIVPFVDTPVNLVHYAAENSILGPATAHLREEFAAGGARADIAAARVTVGAAVMAGTLEAYDLGLITGTGPDKWEDKQAREMTGWQGESLYIAGEYYGVSRTDPLAMTIFGIVNNLDKAKYAREEQDVLTSTVGAILSTGQHALDATFMRGMNDFLNVLKGNKDVKGYIANFVPGMVPYSNLIKTAQKIEDPQPRRISKDKQFENEWGYLLKQKVKSGIPGLASDLRPARYWDGSMKMPKNGVPVSQMTAYDKIENAMFPIKSTKPQPRDLATEALLENDAVPREPQPVITLGNVQFSLLTLDDGTGKLYDAYIREVGKQRRDMVNQILKTDEYKEMNAGYNSERQRLLKRGIANAQKAGLSIFLDEILPQWVTQNKQSANALALTLGFDPEELIDMAADGRLGPFLTDKTKVRDAADQGQLPLPIHTEDQPKPRLPEF